VAWTLRHQGTDEAQREQRYLERIAQKLVAEGKHDEVPESVRVRPDLWPGDEPVVRAWAQLHQQRGEGMEQQPLAMVDVEAWMRVSRIPEDRREDLLAGILACERGWHEVRGERAKREAAVDGRRP